MSMFEELRKASQELRTQQVLAEVAKHRSEQEVRYGHVNDLLEDGTGPETRWLLPYTKESAEHIEDRLRDDYEQYEDENTHPTWLHLVREEVAEVFMEDDPIQLRAELIQVAALCVSWVERLDERRVVAS